MSTDEFRFKSFSLFHGSSSMKIGVDAVLVGSWSKCINPKRILDVGTGCGVIAMILGYRFPQAKVDAIDIDKNSIIEANLNFKNSSMRDRLRALLKKFPEDLTESEGLYDMIVSNPPYFDSGVIHPTTPREKARHQASLSPSILVANASRFLNQDGILSMIFPMDFKDKIKEQAERYGLSVNRECNVRNNPASKEKRVIIEFINGRSPLKDGIRENLTLFRDGNPTIQYKNLCKDLYLKF